MLRAIRLVGDLIWIIIIYGGAIAIVVLAWRAGWLYGLIVAAILAFILFLAWTTDRNRQRDRERAAWVDKQMLDDADRRDE